MLTERGPGRALRELERVRAARLHADGHDIHLVTPPRGPSPLQARILTALGVDTTNWDRAHIT